MSCLPWDTLLDMVARNLKGIARALSTGSLAHASSEEYNLRWVFPMSEPVLATKLHIPRLRPNLVSRPRLSEQLDEGMNHELVLVVAPAGFGKTTALSTWITQSSRHVTWLSLDEGNGETILTGVMKDQSALHGVLIKVRDLGLTLVSVRRIEVRPRQDSAQWR
jgi:hypothetical protein